MITLGIHTGCIGGIFITGIFGNFYTKRGGFLTFKTGIPGGLADNMRSHSQDRANALKCIAR